MQDRTVGSSSYPHLFTPLDTSVGQLRNRIIMGSMHTRLETERDATSKQVAFYAERARGEAAMIITGGFSPNEAGLMEIGGPRLDSRESARVLAPIPAAVHQEGGLICAQILHAGRYARHDNAVGPSEVRSPINPRTPRVLTTAEVWQTVEDFATTAAYARAAGFDGVEIMGSEGYLINQFTTRRANHRDDEWGGSTEKRHRFPLEILRRVRETCGRDFLVIYRISALDLVEGGATGEEIALLAVAAEAAGADIISTGIGWHEARVPTIAYVVPRGIWREAAARVKQVVSVPVVASNRINTPETAEKILASGDADLVSLARPMLADPHFARKAREGRPEDINTCIACNQACLDYIFSDRTATCLVNPRACRETEFGDIPTETPLNIAVVGGGPAGMSCAAEAGRLGHRVVLFEATDRLGGQLNLARIVPGKAEFDELLRYYRRQLVEHGVDVRLGCRATAADLAAGFDHIVLATGVTPQVPAIPGVDHPNVATYAEILSGQRGAGDRVAIIGAGGIGFDVAEFLTQDAESFFDAWAVDPTMLSEGGLAGDPLAARPTKRKVVMLQRKATKPGASLGVSTGWILRNTLRKRGVETLAGVTYEKIDDAGVHVRWNGQRKVIEADTVVLCAGQEPEHGLEADLRARRGEVVLLGGAENAFQLDARRAIDDGIRVAQRFGSVRER